MNILVTRDTATARSVTSVVTTDGFTCFGLEPAWDPSGTIKPRAIPPGTYDVEIQFSPEHGRRVPVLQNVPGFTMIEIHWGNFEFPHLDSQGQMHPPDSLGCLVVGKQRKTDEVDNSVATFNILVAMLDQAEQAGEDNTITYVNAFAAAAAAVPPAPAD